VSRSGLEKYFYTSLAPELVKFKSTSPTKFLTSPTNILMSTPPKKKLLAQTKLCWSQQRTPDSQVGSI